MCNYAETLRLPTAVGEIKQYDLQAQLNRIENILTFLMREKNINPPKKKKASTISLPVPTISLPVPTISLPVPTISLPAIAELTTEETDEDKWPQDDDFYERALIAKGVSDF